MFKARAQHKKIITNVLFFLPLLVFVLVSFFLPGEILAGDTLDQFDPTINNNAGWFESRFNKAVYGIAVTIGGLFVWAGGWLLNHAVNVFVLQMGEWLNGNLGIAVNMIWTIVRDTINITFIFALIYLGLRTIWNADDTGTKRQLALLIMAALLINFSLLITKLVVDFSNVAAIQIYNAAFVPATDSDEGLVFARDGISSYFMNLIQLQTFAVPASDEDKIALGGIVGFSVIMMIFLIATGLIFAAGAVMLTIRFIALVLLMMFSPVMFLGWIIPPLKSYADRWKSALLSYSFFAPAFLFLVYLAFYTLNMLKYAEDFIDADNPNYADALSGNSSAVVMILFLFVSLGFMIAALLVGRQMSMVGSTLVISGVNKATRTITYFPRSGARWVANSIGRGVEKGLNRVQANTLKNGGEPSLIADRVVRGMSQKMRGTEFGTGTTKDKDEEARRRMNIRAADTLEENQNKQDIKMLLKKLKDSGTKSKDYAEAVDNLGKVVRRMSAKEKQELDHGILTNQAIAMHLNDKDYEYMQNSGNVAFRTINQSKQARSEAIKSVAKKGAPVVVGAEVHQSMQARRPAKNDQNKIRASLIRNSDIKTIGKMPEEIFTDKNMYNFITPAMLEERLRNNVSDQAKSEIEQALKGHLLTMNNVRNTQELKKWKTAFDNNLALMDLNVQTPSPNTTSNP